MLNDESVRKLFAEYEKAFEALDLSKSAEFFADTFISAGPRGVIAQSKVEFLKLAHQAADFYKSIGQTSARILSMMKNPLAMSIQWLKSTGE